MYYLLLIPIIYVSFCYIKNKYNKKPKGYTKDKKIKDYVPTYNIRNGFSKKKIPENIDTIVIGSGIGGLTCAGLLSKVGKRVLVLEQHYIAGGCTHCFEDKGYEFDTGLHYIGNIEKRKKILDLITSPKIQWDKMGTAENNYLYDTVQIGDDIYHFAAGKKQFLKEISKHFPEEVDNVIRYINYAEKISKHSLYFNLKILRCKILAKLINYYFNKSFFNTIGDTTLDVIKRFTSNKKLQSLLCYEFGGYGKCPSKQLFFIHASYFIHYLDGAWYPNGGSSVIAKNIIPIIQQNGGNVLVRKRVQQIIIKDGEAKGVLMENGVKIYAKNIVSGIGVINTWKHLIDNNYITKNLNLKLLNIKPSISFINAFIGFDKNADELDLVSNNIWYFEDPNLTNIEFDTEILDEPLKMFISFSCKKDKSWNSRFPGKSTATILIMCKYSQFNKWKNTKWNKRGESYNLFKEQLLKKILDKGLYKLFPKTVGHVKYCELGTPLTYKHFLNSPQGACYGIDNTKYRYNKNDWLTTDTYIKNLYMTGQDITTLGVTGALMGGVLTAHSILGYGTIKDLLLDRNLITDLIKMETLK